MTVLSTDLVLQWAAEEEFDVCGVTSASPVDTHANLERWLAQGCAADMQWIRRSAGKRGDPTAVFPDARSIVTVGVSYFTEDPPAQYWNDPRRGKIARYAWGPDYHNVLLPMLERLARRIAAATPSTMGWRVYVDTGPLLERALAARSSVGFVGRNTLLIHPRMGSYLFLGELLLSIPLDPTSKKPRAAAEPCGKCRRCLAACPTKAFPTERVLDARRCIAYHTIENRGAIPIELRAAHGRWLFGCDVCQEVCPWVRSFSRPSRRPFLAFEPNLFAPRLSDVLGWKEKDFRERYQGTPVLRARWRGFLRNALIATGNSGCRDLAAFVEPHTRSDDPLIREHAEWAKQQLLRMGKIDGRRHAREDTSQLPGI